LHFVSPLGFSGIMQCRGRGCQQRPREIKKPPRRAAFLSGGARRDRTADLLHAMQALSQLSYGPNAQNS
jgi:hypothetical protein